MKDHYVEVLSQLSSGDVTIHFLSWNEPRNKVAPQFNINQWTVCLNQDIQCEIICWSKLWANELIIVKGSVTETIVEEFGDLVIKLGTQNRIAAATRCATDDHFWWRGRERYVELLSQPSSGNAKSQFLFWSELSELRVDNRFSCSNMFVRKWKHKYTIYIFNKILTRVRWIVGWCWHWHLC